MQIEPTRIHPLKQCDTLKEGKKANYVLYWMQASQRVEFNPALEYAIGRANALGLPLVVGFGVMDDYPEANLRHYTFMLEGLQDAERQLDRRGIQFVLQHGHPAKVAIELGRDAAEVVCDRGYLRHQRAWRKQVAAALDCTVTEIEGDIVVPVETASHKEEFAARTLRPKVTRLFADYLCDWKPLRPVRSSLGLPFSKLPLDDVTALAGRLKLDRSVRPVSHLFVGGETEAKRVFEAFLERRMRCYAEHRNQPQTDDVSHMSKFLHFGQVSPVWLAKRAREAAGASDENVRTFIEELLVRRELAINFAWFNPEYDRYEGLPTWSRQDLAEHAKDRRPVVYSLEQMESARTGDPYWNASMREMVHTGFMHNYMRMYWGKKILEWSPTPEEAFERALMLNNKYFLDGRDPNSFTGVAWIFGKHDRPFTSRAIFGKVRYMNAAGLERKCNIKAYVRKVERLMISPA